MKPALVTFVACIVVLADGAWPCSVDDPCDFFAIGGRSLHELPETLFLSEFAEIVGGAYSEVTPYYHYDQQINGLINSVHADIADLNECLHGHPDADALVATYEALRNAMNLIPATELVLWRGEALPENYEPPEFDPETQDAFLAALPEEFAFYVHGAQAYHDNEWEQAVEWFSKVLTLEPEKRMYKGVWAAFMLGKLWIDGEDHAQAAQFFARARELADAGGRDPLYLAGESWGWQARMALQEDDPVQALKYYIVFSKTPGSWNVVSTSLPFVIRDIVHKTVHLQACMQDDQLRQIITAWVNSRSHLADSLGPEWLQMAATLTPQPGFPGADRLAWLAYQCGEMEQAAHWTGLSAPDAPRAQWVRAKLMLRDGLIEEGQALLEALATAAADANWTMLNTSYPVPAAQALFAESAAALLQENKYQQALKRFLLAEEWGDAAFVAERIMTVRELKRFIKKNRHDDKLSHLPASKFYYDNSSSEPPSWISLLEHLLARRLARAGRWEAALRYYPTETWSVYTHSNYGAWDAPLPLNEQARQVVEHLNAARDESLSRRERAQHYFEAAKMVRRDGMDLLGSELAPDWRLVRGDWFNSDDNIITNSAELLTPKALRRIAKSVAVPDRRFHYRFVAADLMKHCAELLPDNDVLTAEALYLGGVYLRNSDPAAADYFYKNLVRRNPNLLIAQQADTLRWFPSQFTDVVRYTPRTWRGISRRQAAYGAALLLGCLVPPAFLAGFTIGRKFSRHNRTLKQGNSNHAHSGD